jgi:aspartate beta-hydroxylase
MTDSTHVAAADIEAAWRDGSRALREGRAVEALEHLNRITAAGQANTVVWLAIAMIQRTLGDRPAELAALQQVLALDPRDLRGLVLTGDHYDAGGDTRAASSYYQAAIQIAAAAPQLDPSITRELGRVQQAMQRITADYEIHVVRELGGRGLERPQARRVRQSLDLLLGKSELYLQQPRHYYFPELPNIAYADRAAFPWMDKVEAATDAIRADLQRVLAEDAAAFAPYIEPQPNRPQFGDNPLTGNPAWSAFYLWKAGAPVPENLARCPSVMPALEDAPLCKIPGRTPSILFSLLRPGAHIAPHHGFTNARYICHLPLIVPEGCAMRVGAETRPWVEGRALAFDDSIEHEAWNHHPDRLRVVMIFDVWRPELSETERALVSALLQAVDTYGSSGPAAPWRDG